MYNAIAMCVYATHSVLTAPGGLSIRRVRLLYALVASTGWYFRYYFLLCYRVCWRGRYSLSRGATACPLIGWSLTSNPTTFTCRRRTSTSRTRRKLRCVDVECSCQLCNQSCLGRDPTAVSWHLMLNLCLQVCFIWKWSINVTCV